MRRVLSALLALIILVCTTGCRAEQEAPWVALCMAQRSNGITAESVAYLEETLREAGLQVQILDAHNDQRKQLEQIEALTQQEYGVMIIDPVMIDAVPEMLQLLESTKTGAIFIHRQPEMALLEGSEGLCYVGPDTAQPGNLQPRLLESLPDCGDVNGDGYTSYVFLGGPEEDLDTQLRLTGIQQTTAMADKILTCLEVCYGQWDRESGSQNLKNQLAKYGKDIEVVFCANDDIATGALAAVEDGGRTVGRDIYLLGIDGQQHAQVLIRSGQMTGTVALDLQAMANTVAELARNLLAGKAVEDRYVTEYILLTQNNIEDFMD